MPSDSRGRVPNQPRAERERGSYHEFYHGRDESPVDRRRGGMSPIQGRRSSGKGAEVPQLSRRDGDRHEPARSESWIAETYRPAYPESSRSHTGRNLERGEGGVIQSGKNSPVHNKERPLNSDTRAQATSLKAAAEPPRPSHPVIQSRSLSPHSRHQMMNGDNVRVTQGQPSGGDIGVTAENAPTPMDISSDSDAPSQQLQQESSKADSSVEGLPLVFQLAQTLMDLSTDTAAQKIECATTKKTVAFRTLEFNKSAPQHSSYPNTRTYQTNARDVAEKSHSMAEERLRTKTVDLNKTATQLVDSLISHIAERTRAAHAQHTTQQISLIETRCSVAERMAKDLEKRCQTAEAAKVNLETQMAEQQRFMDELKSDMKIMRDAANKEQSSSKSRQHNADQAETKLKQETLEVANELAAYKANQSARLQQLSIDISNVESNTNNEIAKVAQDVKTLSDVQKLPARPQTDQSLAASLVSRLSAFEQGNVSLLDRLEKSEVHNKSTSSNLTALQTRLGELENAQTQNTSLFTHQQGLIEARPTGMTKTEMESAILAKISPVTGRISSLEARDDAMHSMIGELQLSIKLQDNVTSSKISQEEIQDLKDRLSRVESKGTQQQNQNAQILPAPVVTSLGSQDSVERIAKLENVISTLENDLTDIAMKQASMVGTITDTVSSVVGDAVDSAIETHVELLKKDFTNLEDKAIKNQDQLKIAEENFSNVGTSLKHLCAQQTKDIENLKNTTPATICALVLQAIQSDPAYTTQLLNVTKSIEAYASQLQALRHGFVNLETRIQNINTGTLATHIISQLPYGKIQADLESTRQAQQVLQSNLKSMGRDVHQDIKDISVKVGTIWGTLKMLEERLGKNDITAADRFSELQDKTETLEREIKELLPTPVDTSRLDTVETRLDALPKFDTSALEKRLSDTQSKVDGLSEVLLALPELKRTVTGFQTKLAADETLRDTVTLIQNCLALIETQLSSENWTSNVKALDEHVIKVQAQVDEFSNELVKYSELEKQFKEVTSKVQRIADYESRITAIETEQQIIGRRVAVSAQPSAQIPVGHAQWPPSVDTLSTNQKGLTSNKANAVDAIPVSNGTSHLQTQTPGALAVPGPHKTKPTRTITPQSAISGAAKESATPGNQRSSAPKPGERSTVPEATHQLRGPRIAHKESPIRSDLLPPGRKSKRKREIESGSSVNAPSRTTPEARHAKVSRTTVAGQVRRRRDVDAASDDNEGPDLQRPVMIIESDDENDVFENKQRLSSRTNTRLAKKRDTKKVARRGKRNTGFRSESESVSGDQDEPDDEDSGRDSDCVIIETRTVSYPPFKNGDQAKQKFER